MMKPGEVVRLRANAVKSDVIESLEVLFDRKSGQKFPTTAVATVLETRTFVKVIVGTTVGWLEETQVEPT